MRMPPSSALPSSQPSFFFFILFFLSVILFAFEFAAAASEDTLSCVEEFGRCSMNRDCCGWRSKEEEEEEDDDRLECITGDWAVTTDSTCFSQRSQKLEALSKEHFLDNNDHKTLMLFLKEYIYKHPAIIEGQQQQQQQQLKQQKTDPLFYEKVAKKYRHEFPRLIKSLERKYKITDSEVMFALIQEFVDDKAAVKSEL